MWNRLAPTAFLAALAIVPQVTSPQADDSLDRKEMRDVLVQLGYEVKDLETEPGKEKYQVLTKGGGLDIPMGVELSGNGSYIWLTVFLGGGEPTADKALKLIKSNATIQPSQFYVTSSGRLMCGLPIENRNVSNALIRQRIEKLTDNVADTQADWK